MKWVKNLFSGKEPIVSKEKLSSLTTDKTGNQITEEVKLSIAAILINLASVDDQVAEEEAETICSLLLYNLEIAEELIPSLIEKAVVIRREQSTMENFVAPLNKLYKPEQKVRVLAMAWKLVMADKKIEKLEEKMLIKLSSMLFLTLEQQDKARILAEEGMD